MHPFSWQRAVIKVGSSLIAPDGALCKTQYLLAIARFITYSRAQGKEVIVVSSGSVAAGRHRVAVTHRPTIAEKQAMAAIGQTQMMANWQRLFDYPCAQLLLTAGDLRDRTRYVNIKNTLRELFKHQALPIVNENDSVAVNELKVGDNDNLAAYTALVAQADTLIICSDVDGLYTSDPRKHKDATLIHHVTAIDEAMVAMAGAAGSAVGTGGMRTKLDAARLCTQSGIQTLIVNGLQAETFEALSQGQVPGTLFAASPTAQRARPLWLTHTQHPRGVIHIDEGAKRALLTQGASLLPSGIVEVSGHFTSGEAVAIHCNAIPVAKGLVLFDARELALIKGLQSGQTAAVLGYQGSRVVIHRDDMVILPADTMDKQT